MSKKDIIDYVMETPGNTNKRVLGRLIDEVEGVKLPDVTEDDNGSVLTVVEGAWDKAEPSGGSGGGLLILTIVRENGEATLSETWQTIFDAYSNGTTVWLHTGNETAFSRCILCGIQSDPNNGYNVEFYNSGSYSCVSPDEKPAIMD